MGIRSAPLLLAFALLAAAVPARAAIDTSAYCSAIRICLKATDRFCTEENSKPNPDIRYDEEFCAPMRGFVGRGVRPGTTDGRAVFSQMGKRFRSVYEIEGELPVNMEILNYVLDNLPFVAMLINAYRGEEYEAAYLRSDKKIFTGTNGRSLSGTFVQPYHQVTRDSVRNFYWGYGRAKVLAWRLKGDGLMEMDFRNLGPRRVGYRVKAYAFPGNSFLNGVMKMGVFRSMVLKKIRAVIEDVEKAAGRFASGDLEPLKRYAPLQTPRGRAYMAEFQDLVHASGYLDPLTALIESHADSVATDEAKLEGRTLSPAASAPVDDYPEAGPVPLPETASSSDVSSSSPFSAPAFGLQPAP